MGALRSVLGILIAGVAVSACSLQQSTAAPSVRESGSETRSSQTASSAARRDAGGWLVARVEQPAEIEGQPTNAPGFCSPCHPNFGSYISAVVRAGNEWVALGYLSPPAVAVAWGSSDGGEWRRIADVPGGDGSLILAGTGDGGDGIVAVGEAGAKGAAWRVSGGSWTITPLPLPAGATSARATAVARTPSGFVAAGYAAGGGGRRAAFWRSADGRAWTSVDALEPPASPGTAEVTGVSAMGSTVVAVGIAGDERTGTAAVWRSADAGATWTRAPGASLSAGRMLAVAAGASGFVAVGEAAGQTGARAWTSGDGRTWQLAPDQDALSNDGQSMTMTAIAPDSAGFVAVGWRTDAGNGSAVVWRSTDGHTWTQVPAGLSFSGAGMSAVNADAGIVAGGTMGWPDTHSAQVWTLSGR